MVIDVPTAAKAAAALCGFVLLNGCFGPTQAQQHAQSMHAAVGMTASSAQACTKAVQSKPEYANVLLHLTETGMPTVSQLTDRGRPTPSDLQAITSWSNEIQPCRKMTLEGMAAAAPTLVPIFIATFQSTDQILAQLWDGKTTWSDVNRRLGDLQLAQTARAQSAMAQIQSSLAVAHQNEVSQRQAALMALAQYSAASRPINTTCNQFGSTVNCTTR